MGAVSARKDVITAPAAASKPAAYIRPRTSDDIVRVMQNRNRFPSPVRPQGSGSSVTRATTAIGGTIVDMTGMARILEIGAETVTVQPGIPLTELAEALREQGKELIGGFDLANRTVGGAVCGAGLEATVVGDVSQFAGHVTRLKVVSATGRKFAVSEKTASLLMLMRLSYGLLGIVYEVTLRIRPIQGFRTRAARVSFEDFSGLGPQLDTSEAGLKLVLFPFNDTIFFELRRPSADARDGSSNFRQRMRQWALYSGLPVVAKSAARLIPLKALRYPLLDNIGTSTQRWMTNDGENASSNAVEQTGRFRKTGPQSFVYCTWGFPATQLTKIAGAYKLFCRMHYAKTGFRCDLPTIAYRLGQDRSALLSPAYDGPLVTLSPLCSDDRGFGDFMFEFAEFATEHSGVPFFNQTTNATPQCVNRCYGQRIEMFRKVRRRLDPENRLLNQFFANYFPAG